MPETIARKPLDPAKFRDPRRTLSGAPRAQVALTGLRTLWFNTGSLCNITCRNCYMDSSPRNDRLAYLTAAEVSRCLDEAAEAFPELEEIGFTGGEPFLNSEFPEMIREALSRGLEVLVLTNAMRPLQVHRSKLLDLPPRLKRRLTFRVSIDHYEPARHEELRGKGSWGPALEGLHWLAANGFRVTAAGRRRWNEAEEQARRGYGALFGREALPINAFDPRRLVLFPEMDASSDVSEISESCWGILGVSPAAMMCATSRMIVKRKGAALPSVVPCTLLPYDPQFDLGPSLARAPRTVSLNHPHCARFCVLGGASCSAR